ncbi:hypothetical protein ACL6C3_13210 [Capilliphycus salinus ALCB114379]|uniref:hypothetical protein n=1 Tax=Capilliphycus salinus TaxID=2768948 RepID=UPI0039A42E7D
MKPLFKINPKIGLYFLTLLFGYTGVGWIFTAFGASWGVWLGTIAVILHLSTAGIEAILLANAWVLGVVFTAVLRKTWPIFLGGYLPKKNAPLWAILMILLWFFAILFIVILGLTRQKLQRMGWNDKQACLSLVAVTGTAFSLGWMVFQLSFP